MKKTIATGSLVVLALVVGPLGSTQESTSASIVGSSPLELSSLTASGTWELRIYTINRGRLDDFVNAWLTGVYPLRIEHEFQIPAAWLIRENNQFVWILGYDGPEPWEDKQAAYYDSDARRSLGVDPLDMIAHGETWNITPVTQER